MSLRKLLLAAILLVFVMTAVLSGCGRNSEDENEYEPADTYEENGESYVNGDDPYGDYHGYGDGYYGSGDEPYGNNGDADEDIDDSDANEDADNDDNDADVDDDDDSEGNGADIDNSDSNDNDADADDNDGNGAAADVNDDDTNDDNDEPAEEYTPEPAVTGVPVGTRIHRINSGSTVTVGDFVADVFFLRGFTTSDQFGVSTNEEMLEIITIPAHLDRPAQPIVYNSVRWAGAGWLGYRFEGLEPGRSYIIRLHVLSSGGDAVLPTTDFRVNGEYIIEDLNWKTIIPEERVIYFLDVEVNADNEGKIAFDIVHKAGNAFGMFALEVIAN